jgi:serine/threonine protein kinase
MIDFISAYLISFFNDAMQYIETEKEIADRGSNEVSIIGEGSFAIIEKHFDKQLNKFVVHKVAKDCAGALDFLEVEWRVLFSLNTSENTHPNIPKVYYITKNIIVMDYIPGKDLYRHITLDKLSCDEMKKIFIQVCDCIAYVHDRDYIHRDLKPENIMYNEETGHVTIIDWGFAKKVTEINHKDSVGSTYYAAPEVVFDVDRRHVGKENDVWSLGIILYVMYNGKMPYQKEKIIEQVRAYKIHWDSSMNPDLKTFLAKIFVPYDVRPTIRELLGDKWFSL